LGTFFYRKLSALSTFFLPLGLDAAEEEERIPHECFTSSVSENAAAATALISEMKLEDCKHPTSYTTLTLPEEEPLIMPYDTNKSTLRTISNKKPQFQPSSSL